jgi:hypothetical protein
MLISSVPVPPQLLNNDEGDDNLIQHVYPAVQYLDIRITRWTKETVVLSVEFGCPSSIARFQLKKIV